MNICLLIILRFRTDELCRFLFDNFRNFLRLFCFGRVFGRHFSSDLHIRNNTTLYKPLVIIKSHLGTTAIPSCWSDRCSGTVALGTAAAAVCSSRASSPHSWQSVNSSCTAETRQARRRWQGTATVPVVVAAAIVVTAGQTAHFVASQVVRVAALIDLTEEVLSQEAAAVAYVMHPCLAT